MGWLGRAYQWFWFHSEWYLTPVNRRPYTFIMRDWIYTHVGLSVLVIIVWFSGVFVWNLYHPVPASIVGFSSAGLLAHLVWGSKYIENQQEFPQYLG